MVGIVWKMRAGRQCVASTDDGYIDTVDVKCYLFFSLADFRDFLFFSEPLFPVSRLQCLFLVVM